jgi:hypothetical protein
MVAPAVAAWVDLLRSGQARVPLGARFSFLVAMALTCQVAASASPRAVAVLSATAVLLFWRAAWAPLANVVALCFYEAARARSLAGRLI